MKSYEQMARDVLRRRDAELRKRKRAFLIGAPFAAAAIVTVTAVGVGAAVSANSRGGHIHDAIILASGSEAVSAVSGGGSVVVSSPADYTNPNAGQTKIVWLSAEKPSAGEPELDEKDFTEYTLEELDRLYDLRFNRLGEVYTDWQLSYDKLGTYRRIFETEAAMGMKPYYYTRNTLNYVTESGGKVTVSAQLEKFEPVSDETFTADKPTTSPKPEVNTEYDKDGNVIGETVAGYTPDPAASVGPAPDPAASVGPAPDPAVSCPPGQTVAPDEGVSTVNGYEALIYRLSDGSFLADLDMNSRVRITAEGISDEKFLEILDNFTK